MKPNTVLTLGDFNFSRYEVPASIVFGGSHALVSHELVGGKRIVDAMGRRDAPLEWSGLFLGENSLARARYVDGLRIAGKPLGLAWSELKYTVVIQSFNCTFERFYRLPYSISCLVVEDLAAPVTSLASAGIDEWITNDMNTASALGLEIGDGSLSALLGTLDAAIKQVSTFAGAVQSTINSVLGPLAAVQARVKILIGASGNVLSNVATVGGILPNNPAARQTSKLLGQVTAMTQSPKLYNLQSVLGRMGGNLGGVNAGKTSAVAGGNLFKMAADAYQDASAWTTIARANALTDPMITGVQNITIPASADDTGGVLSA